jgi:hypothetical protein
MTHGLHSIITHWACTRSHSYQRRHRGEYRKVPFAGGIIHVGRPRRSTGASQTVTSSTSPWLRAPPPSRDHLSSAFSPRWQVRGRLLHLALRIQHPLPGLVRRESAASEQDRDKDMSSSVLSAAFKICSPSASSSGTSGSSSAASSTQQQPSHLSLNLPQRLTRSVPCSSGSPRSRPCTPTAHRWRGGSHSPRHSRLPSFAEHTSLEELGVSILVSFSFTSFQPRLQTESSVKMLSLIHLHQYSADADANSSCPPCSRRPVRCPGQLQLDFPRADSATIADYATSHRSSAWSCATPSPPHLHLFPLGLYLHSLSPHPYIILSQLHSVHHLTRP